MRYIMKNKLNTLFMFELRLEEWAWDDGEDIIRIVNWYTNNDKILSKEEFLEAVWEKHRKQVSLLLENVKVFKFGLH